MNENNEKSFNDVDEEITMAAFPQRACSAFSPARGILATVEDAKAADAGS
jgi:hypothetical protein